MADSILDAISYFENLPAVATKAAQLAINDVARRGGLKLIRNEILDQVSFPRDYLTGDRLAITQFATSTKLEAVITARKRATSLARFAPGQSLGSKARLGVRVAVGTGKSTVLRKAWLVRLRRGASLTEDNYNIGLAVRVRPGETIKNKKGTHQSWLVPNSVALLYGPSVDQVFREVSGDVAAPIGSLVTDEFFRQFSRLA